MNKKLHHYLSLFLHLAILGLSIAILVKVSKEDFRVYDPSHVNMSMFMDEDFRIHNGNDPVTGNHLVGEHFQLPPHHTEGGVGGIVYEKFKVEPHLQEMKYSTEFAVQNQLVPAGVYCTGQVSNNMGGLQALQLIIKPDQTCTINVRSCCYNGAWLSDPTSVSNTPFSVTDLGGGKYHIDIKNQDNGTFTLDNNKHPVFQLGNYYPFFKGTYTFKSSDYNNSNIC